MPLKKCDMSKKKFEVEKCGVSGYKNKNVYVGYLEYKKNEM